MDDLPAADALKWLMCGRPFVADELPRWPAWMLGAACLAADPDVFFPEKGGGAAEAVAVCEGCAVRDDCLEYAMKIEEREKGAPATGPRAGVWGGLTPSQRQRLARERRRAAPGVTA